MDLNIVVFLVLATSFIVSLCFIINKKRIPEFFNESVGQMCGTCEGKTINQCLACFNCGFCVDKFGNSKCVGGDVASGAYNKENCAMWYVRDPFQRMQQMNDNYKCSYGPPQKNRVI